MEQAPSPDPTAEQKLAFERGLIRQMEADLAAKDEVSILPLLDVGPAYFRTFVAKKLSN